MQSPPISLTSAYVDSCVNYAIATCIYILKTNTVKPPNNSQARDGAFGPCREVGSGPWINTYNRSLLYIIIIMITCTMDQSLPCSNLYFHCSSINLSIILLGGDLRGKNRKLWNRALLMQSVVLQQHPLLGKCMRVKLLNVLGPAPQGSFECLQVPQYRGGATGRAGRAVTGPMSRPIKKKIFF